mgnify:FL=1|tara:strand:- start:3515 stop:3886 length:372 start_codon:yes stop_codon:yes gene_type:complete
MKILGKPHTKFAQDERKIKELKEKNKELEIYKSKSIALIDKYNNENNVLLSKMENLYNKIEKLESYNWSNGFNIDSLFLENDNEKNKSYSKPFDDKLRLLANIAESRLKKGSSYASEQSYSDY